MSHWGHLSNIFLLSKSVKIFDTDTFGHLQNAVPDLLSTLRRHLYFYMVK